MLRFTRWQPRRPRALVPLQSLHALRRGYAGVAELSSFPKVGEQLHGFTLKRIKEVPELELTALHLLHDETGADHLHLSRDDSNNVFSIAFQTIPPDSTGVPHILEHTTLCGSEKYPIRDPFFKMLPRSLSNFMNAGTSFDHTAYPFATTNAQDFRNLLSVYLDATLHPLLKEDDFSQEGWRIGPQNPRSEDATPLVFKGVVYNEMKGMVSDGNYSFYVKWHEHFIPALNNSGGDPQMITDLTWEQLRKFHRDHYHPSNAKIFTYGNMPLAEHLKEIDDQLRGFGRINVDHQKTRPIQLDGPKSVTVQGPLDTLLDPDRQYKTSVSWYIGEDADVVEQFALEILSDLLLNGYSAQLHGSLIASGLGIDWSSNAGYTKGKFTIGLTGVKREDVPKVKDAISKHLLEVRRNGFEQIKVDGILHRLEFSRKHKTANFGLNMMYDLQGGWFQGIDPLQKVGWEGVLEAFHSRYAEGDYLEGLLEKYLLNDNTFTFTMEPSETYSQELASEESKRLAEKIQDVTKQFASEQEAQLYLEKRELELLEVQEKAQHEDLSCLPTLHVKDIPREKEPHPLRHTDMGDVKVQWREAPTNGITYFRAVHRLQDLPDELRQLIPLFAGIVKRLGTKSKTSEKLDELIKLKTGGIGFGYHNATSPLSTNSFEEGLSFEGIAFDRNVPDMYDLLRMLIMEADFDSPKAESLIWEFLQTSVSGALNSVAENGHSYATTFAAAGLRPVARLNELTGGLTQIKFMAHLASRSLSPGSLEDVIQKLKAIQAFVIGNSRNLRVAMTCGHESATPNQEALKRFLDSLPKDVAVSTSPSSEATFPRNSKTFFSFPYQVYYAAQVMPTVPYIDPSSAPLEILAELLTHRYLHHEIREKGGAYGGGASVGKTDGVFAMSSYRDPNPQNTMNIMAKAGQWARDRAWTPRDLEEAKLSVFKHYDAPYPVSVEGIPAFLSGITDDMVQTRRERLLDVTAEQVQKVADDFLVKREAENNVVVLGEMRDWVDTNNGWETRDMGMAKKEETVEEAAEEAAEQATDKSGLVARLWKTLSSSIAGVSR